MEAKGRETQSCQSEKEKKWSGVLPQTFRLFCCFTATVPYLFVFVCLILMLKNWKGKSHRREKDTPVSIYPRHLDSCTYRLHDLENIDFGSVAILGHLRSKTSLFHIFPTDSKCVYLQFWSLKVIKKTFLNQKRWVTYWWLFFEDLLEINSFRMWSIPTGDQSQPPVLLHSLLPSLIHN